MGSEIRQSALKRSSIRDDDLRYSAFNKQPGCHGCTVLYTNVADSGIGVPDSGIGVPDVKCATDLRLVKPPRTNPATRRQNLQLCWSSGRNCTRRADRTGRATDRGAYRLATSSFNDIICQDRGKREKLLPTPLANLSVQRDVIDDLDESQVSIHRVSSEIENQRREYPGQSHFARCRTSFRARSRTGWSFQST
ncbi:probable ATP-dependent RNA helicase spindle-E isoform X2 [Temnothorax nylanderi]|uniref:probable ATP-dependent RNA helicase spindle-E isoform X2 n=1 Tax=Temnothorax nylanderi TaxID=102681 RepID=UPI003A860ACB